HDRVLDRRTSADLERLREHDEAVERAPRQVRAPDERPLVLQGRATHDPSLSALADDVRGRHPDVLEEDLVEVSVARHLAEGTDVETRRLHVDQEVADPVVLRLIRLGADEREHPVRLPRTRCPDLLAVDDPGVTLEDGARAERREVAAGAGLAVPLTPADLPEERVPDEEVLLRLGAVLEERRDEHARPLAHDLVRCVRAAELLADDRGLQRIRRLLRAAVPPRDVTVEIAALDRLETERGHAFVGDAAPDVRRGGLRRRLSRGILGGPVLAQEAANFGAELLVFGAVREIHSWALPGSGRSIAYQVPGAADKRRVSRGARSRRTGRSPSTRSADRRGRRRGCAAPRGRGRAARADRRCPADLGSSNRTDPGAERFP